MASRLSDEALVQTYDSGHNALPWALPSPPPELDLAEIAAQPDGAAVIAALSPSDLHRSLKALDVESALDVLPLITAPQLTGILDIEAWPDQELSPRHAMRWLRVFGEISAQAMVERYRSLEEEYQIAILRPFVRLFDEEEFEKLATQDQDRALRLPCGTLFVIIDHGDEDVVAFVEQLIEGGLAEDVQYTYSLLAHAFHAVPGDNEALLKQFRTARLEEEGFVSADEAAQLFHPVSLSSFQSRVAIYRQAGQTAGLVPIQSKADDKTLTLLERAVAWGQSPTGGAWTAEEIERIKAGLARTGNGLAAAVRLEPNDEDGMRRVLIHQRGLMSLSLDGLSGGQVSLAAEILRREHPAVILRAAWSFLDPLRKRLLQLATSLPYAEKIRQHLELNRFGRALYLIDAHWAGLLDIQDLHYVKGVMNRFPMRPVEFADGGSNQATRVTFVPLQRAMDLVELEGRLDRVQWPKASIVDATSASRVAHQEEQSHG